MRYLTPVLGLAGAVAGLAAAAGGYQLVSAPEATSPPGSGVAAVGRPLPAAPPRVIQRVAPCVGDARLHDGVCVRHVWRTVVVHDPVPAGSGSLGGTASGSTRTDDRTDRSTNPTQRTEDHADDHPDDHGDGHDDGPEHEDD